MSAANALQAAIFARLSGDAGLRAATGPDGIRDRPPETAERPAVVIAGIDSLDWSTASEPGETHAVAIAVEGGEGGHRTVQALAAEVRALLHDAALPLAGHHLVNLRHESTRTARSPARRGHVAMLVFRAVTEPQP